MVQSGVRTLVVREQIPAGALGVESYARAVQSVDPGKRLIAHMLATLNAAVPARTLALAPLDRDGDATGPGVVMRNGPVPVAPQETRREYLRRYHHDDPLHPRLQSDTGRVLLSTSEVGDARSLARTSFGGEFLPAHGFAHVARLYLRDHGRLVASVMLARTPEEGDFREDEMAFLRRAHAFIESSYACALATAAVPGTGDFLAEAGLTAREREVAGLAASGLRTREIANVLVLSEATVKTHLARIFAKVGVKTRAELAARVRVAA